MNNSIDTDTNNVSRKVINIRATTYDDLDDYREEAELGKKMSWDEWFRKLMREGRLQKPKDWRIAGTAGFEPAKVTPTVISA